MRTPRRLWKEPVSAKRPSARLAVEELEPRLVLSAAPRVVLISLDGATLRLVDQYLASGALPADQRLEAAEGEAIHCAPVRCCQGPGVVVVGAEERVGPRAAHDAGDAAKPADAGAAPSEVSPAAERPWGSAFEAGTFRGSPRGI